jgi:anti-sigma factor RsiW
MTCDEARALFVDARRGRLSVETLAALDAHVAGCPACAHEAAADALLGEAIEGRLPQHAAPLGLKRRLAASWAATGLPAPPPTAAGAASTPREDSPRPAGPARAAWSARWRRALVPALAAAVLVLALVPLYSRQAGDGGAAMVTEAVNDHLRLLTAQHPLDIESGGIHQVKPWFEGRLDFAPVVRFEGDAEFPLRGGAVGYYLDRKAAVFVFNRRLHVVTLLVFPAQGLPWARRGLERLGPVEAQVTASRGFNTILWREGDLGYALVSDVDRAELLTLLGKLAASS